MSDGSGSVSEMNSGFFKNDDSGYVTCPYDKTHRILPLRLAAHLMRCARNHTSSKLVRCPFNTTHMLRSDELQAHIYECQHRHTFMRFCYADKLPPETPHAAPVDVVESTENWDIEPPEPSYEPQAYCEANKIVRDLQGAPRAVRRQFRQDERQRFNDKKFL
ncbi:hypothetical protein KR222_003970 [Zaprionus bogoriensis]|nr:hypothetical protein KR222_003970 [Zaprionus bogoriensis]